MASSFCCNMFLVQVTSRLLGSGPVVCASSFVRNMDNQSNDGYSVRSWGGKNWWSFHSQIGMHIWMRSHICVIMVGVISWVFIEHRRLVHESPWCARLLHWSHSEWTCECCNALTMSVYFHFAGKYIQYDEANHRPCTLESESAVEQVVTEARAPKRIRRN